jgi:5'-3' exonuclease
MTKNNKLILIDGSSVLSTSFFGNLPKEYFKAKTDEEKEKVFEKVMKTSDGRYTNGVYTMCKILLNIIKKQKPTHMAVCWDVNRSSLERKKKFDGYKSHRKDTIPQLGAQFGLMAEVLEHIGIPTYKLEGQEADDIIGTFAKSFESELPTYVLTKDQDALQLVSENTRVWLTTSKSKEMYKERGVDVKTLQIPDGTFEFTPTTFEEEYGLTPIQIIDLKALEGDSSDNIPGVKGVGKESVTKLLQEYGTIENLYENIEGLSENEEKELKQFFKDELKITRSPISNLLKRPNSEIVNEIETLLMCSKKLMVKNSKIK